MSALEKFLMKAKGAGKSLMKGAEEYGPAGAFRNTGAREGLGGEPIMEALEGNNRIGGLEKFVKENPREAIGTAAAMGLGGAGGGALAASMGDDDDDDDGLKALLHKLGL